MKSSTDEFVGLSHTARTVFFYEYANIIEITLFDSHAYHLNKCRISRTTSKV